VQERINTQRQVDAVVFTGLEIEFYLFVDLESLMNPPSPSFICFFIFLCLLIQFPHDRTRCVTPGPVIQYSGIMQHVCGMCYWVDCEQGCPRYSPVMICKTRVRREYRLWSFRSNSRIFT